MQSEFGSNRRKSIFRQLAVSAFLVGVGIQSPGVFGQDNPEASWRQGVSRWNGQAYGMPGTTNSSAIASQPVPLARASNVLAPVASQSATPVISEAPYTIPVDPTRRTSAPTGTPFISGIPDIPGMTSSGMPPNAGMTVSGTATQSNPYFSMPPIDQNTTLQLDSPGSVSQRNVLPTYVLPTELSQNVSSRMAGPDPINQLEMEEEILPAPRNVLPSDTTAGGLLDTTPNVSDLSSDETPTLESIGEQIETQIEVDTEPLESEVIRWYQYPQRWMRGWNSHAELGIDGSNGNSQTLAIQTGLETKRETELETWAIDFDYRQASNRSTITEDNGRLNLDYDRLLRDSSWAGFGKFGMEWDKFKPFDLRVWGNSGLGYHWIRTDDATLVTRFGAGASKEIGAPDDDWIPEAIFGGEAERQLTSRQKIKAKVEYFPAWTDFGNFRLVNDLAWEILLDGSENLSLKLAATDRYDSTPQGAKKNDVYYSLLLLYKF